MNLTPDDLYTALVSSGRINSLRRLTYRCAAQKCLLLDAVETPQGVLLYQKRYKLSPAINEATSTESGRRANTYDGLNHWRSRAYWLSQAALAWLDQEIAFQSLDCDHVLQYRLTPRRFDEDWTRGETQVRINARS